MAAVAVDVRVGDEVVQMAVVPERGAAHFVRRVVDQSSEEGERLGLLQSSRLHTVSELHLERRRLMGKLERGSIDGSIERRERRLVRKPLAEGLPRLAPGLLPSAAASDV